LNTLNAVRDALLAMLKRTTQEAPWEGLCEVFDLEDASGAFVVGSRRSIAATAPDGSVFAVTGQPIGDGRLLSTVDAGTTDGFRFTNATALPLSGDFAVCLWTKIGVASASGSKATLVSFGGDSGFRLYFSDDIGGDFIAVSVGGVEKAKAYVASHGGEWVHYAVSRSAGDWTFFRNGAPIDGTSTTDTTSFVGLEVLFGMLTYDGFVDQVAFFSQSKGEADFTLIYGAGNGLPYVNRALLDPWGPFKAIQSGPFTIDEDPETVRERISPSVRTPCLLLSLPGRVPPPDSDRCAGARVLHYESIWKLVAIFPTLRDNDSLGSREELLGRWWDRFQELMTTAFVNGIPATPHGWAFREVEWLSASTVWTPAALMDVVDLRVKVSSTPRNFDWPDV